MTSNNVLFDAQPGDTLLSYGIAVDPDPLRVNGKGTLTLVVSAPGRSAITCTSIKVYIPNGPQAKNLTTDTDIETDVPAGWSVKPEDGAYNFLPGGDAGKIGASGVVFTFASININGEPGTATIAITETATAGSQPAQARDASIQVYKFPVAFTLSELDCDPADIASGGATTLTWNSTGDSVTYAIDYHPADGGDPVEATVGAAGPYVAKELTRTGSVTFTLVATMTIPGQDSPIVARRQATVSIENVSLQLVVQPPAVGVNGLVRLSWRAPNADYCTLEDGTRLPAAGTRYLTLAATRTFLMTAYGGTQSVQDQRQVTVDPTIVPTEAGYVITGGPGGQGADGQVCNDDPSNPFGGGCYPTPGAPGGHGGDARVDGQLPPLDTTLKPGRVIPITLTGGPGGPGGLGGCSINEIGLQYDQQPDGPGGPGGDAVIDATFDKDETPAQYIVVLKPGTGGTGSSPGPAGAAVLPSSDAPEAL